MRYYTSLMIGYLTFPNTIQFLAIIFSVALGYLLSRLISPHLLFETIEEKFGANAKKFIQPLADYAVFVILLVLMAGFSLLIFGEAKLISVGLQISLIVWVAHYIYAVTKNKAISTLIFGWILFSWSVKRFAFLRSIEGFVDKFSMTIGSFEVTPGTFIRALVVVTIFVWITSVLSKLGRSQIEQLKGPRGSTKILLLKGYDVLLFFLATVVALHLLGIDLTALTVIGGALGVGIGFGLQKITSNFISGIILIAEHSIKKGDLIELDSGMVGVVKTLAARYTLIEMSDGREVFIPNEDFITSRVTNWTYSSKMKRIDIQLGVAYGSDLELVQKLLTEAAQSHPRCLKTPEVNCYLSDFADSAVMFILEFYVEDVKAGIKNPKSDVLFAIWKSFKKHKIEIPFPQREVRLVKDT